MTENVSPISKRRLPQNFMEAAADFEKSKIEEIKHSRQMAWLVAIISTAICTIAIIGFLVALLTRPEPEPVILQVDQSTGATTMLRSIKDASDKYDEVVNKYWLAQYIRQCEGYDWYSISTGYEACKLMSEPDVAREYDRKVRAPDAPLTQLKDRGKVRVEIVSTTFIGTTAQVRYTTEKLNSSGENMDQSPVQKWIATVVFNFKAGVMTDQQRLVNPLGFKVYSIRIDPEVSK